MIKYPNLEAEKARIGINNSNLLVSFNGKTLKTVYNKLNGKSEPTINEAIQVQKDWFPDLKLEYLFAREN